MNDYLSKPVTIEELAEILDLTAQFQIKWDIPLVAQLSMPKPVLDTKNNEELKSKICSSMSKLTEQIAKSIHNPTDLAYYLHTLKGCAGQARFIKLREEVIILEKGIHEKGEITAKDIKKVKDLINKKI